MAGIVTLQLIGTVTGDPFGAQGVNPSPWVINGVSNQQSVLALAPGDSAPYPIPPNTRCLILLPLQRAARVGFRRSDDPTAPGWPINRGDFPTVLPLDPNDPSPPSALIFNADVATRLAIKVL